MCIHAGYFAKFVVFQVKLSWSSGFREHLLGRLWGEKVIYSRGGMPVVYAAKNLLYGSAFSDFVWDYFAGHYKMRANT